ncbi:MAG: hypothetical protein AAGJ93_13615, partial [Bacteroidota bacterium]
MKKITVYLIIGFLFGSFSVLTAQDEPSEADARTIRQIYDLALTESSCYEWLHHLCKEVGGRIVESLPIAPQLLYKGDEA